MSLFEGHTGSNGLYVVCWFVGFSSDRGIQSPRHTPAIWTPQTSFCSGLIYATCVVMETQSIDQALLGVGGRKEARTTGLCDSVEGAARWKQSLATRWEIQYNVTERFASERDGCTVDVTCICGWHACR